MEGLTAEDPQAVGEFRLRARLGAGGMGQVYLATSPGGRMVAVKVIRPELVRDSEFVRRFRAEVDAARRVSGMYTAPVVAAGVDDRPPWLATAFVPGPSLDGMVTRYGPLPVPALWRLAAGLADALHAIHSTGLVHRDLKPANVLLASDGPRVIDFGIARAVTESRLTATGSIIGTPPYMSPEQVEGNAVEPTSDVFSLGSVLAFAACGESPFSAGPGGSPASVLYRVVHGAPELGSVPPQVRGLIQACLAKDPGRRPGPGQIAARCAAAAERLGMSPVAFWPAEVARAIEAQHAAMTAQMTTLPVTSASEMVTYPGMSTPRSGTYPGMAAVQPAARTGVAQSQSGTHRAPGPALGGVSRRGLLIGAGIGGALAVAGASAWIAGSRPAQSTPQHVGYDPVNPPALGGTTGTGTGAGAGPVTSGPAASTAWTFTTGDEVLADPGVGNGVVYVGSKDNNLYAINAATGKQVWKVNQGWITAAPQVINGMVCASTVEGEFSAIIAATGIVKWQQETETAASFKPNWAADGNSVILPSPTQPLTVYDAVTGTKAATTYGEPGQFIGGALAAANGVLYAIEPAGALHAVRIATGTALWNRSVSASGSGAFASLVIGDGTLYVTDESGHLYSLNAATGASNWTYPAGGSLLTTPVTAGGLVYVTDAKGTLHAITAAGGTQAWTHQALSSGEIGPAVSGSTIYFSTGLALQALDAKTGNAVWSYTPPNGGALVSTPAVANGLVFVGSTNDNLYAVHG